MYLSIVLLPLIGSFLSGLFGKVIGRQGSIFISSSFVAISLSLSVWAFYHVGILGIPVHSTLFEWVSSGSLTFSWSLLFDSLTVMMLLVVCTVSLLVHLYSINYMEGDPHSSRFFSYLSLFTFFMLVLVTSNNLIQLFVGWEGVGVCSYLLINFWYTRIQANKAALKAMIINRIGDFGVTLGIIVLFYVTKSVDFSIIFSLAPYLSNYTISFLGVSVNVITLACILLFVGVVGKSAQIGLHTWLPDAMEGPTPVSALIHAATMVTAGVFLLIRCSPLFEYSNAALLLVTIVGAMTAFFAATTGLMQNDLKRVIAYSTCSQLGYMVFACGLSSYSVSAFHLMNHAFFKALLFLAAGSVIHALMDEQDMRKMGGLYSALPFTYVMILVGSLALMGFPFLTGYYSKDVILELAFANYEIKGMFAYWLGLVSAGFTAYYSFRLIYLTFLSNPNGSYSVFRKAEDAPIYMATSLIVLLFGSIFVGYLFKDMIIGLGTTFWNGAIFNLPENVYFFESEFLPFSVKILPFFFSIGGAILGVLMFSAFKSVRYVFDLSFLGRKVYLYLNKKWFFDTLYNEWIAIKSVSFGYNYSFKLLDRGLIEYFGPYGIEVMLKSISYRLKGIHSGYLYHSAFLIFIGAVFALLLVEFSFFNNFKDTFIFVLVWYFLYILTSGLIKKN